MGLKNFCLNLFAFIINSLEMLFRYFTVAQITHYQIITATRTALNSFIVGEAEGYTINIRKYFIIKRTPFVFEKKFATTGNRRRYC